MFLLFKKGFAWFVFFSFLANGMAFGSTASLPAEWGQFKEAVAESGSSRLPHIIYIQDAHANGTAQESIKNALVRLTDQYGLKQVFVEGAAQSVTLNPQILFPDLSRDENVSIAENLMKQGELSGVDLALLIRNGELKGEGIENIPAYRENIRAFRKVIGSRAVSAAYIQDLLKRFDQLASRKLNPVLLKVLRLHARLDSDRNFRPQDLQLTVELAKKHLNLDFTDPKNLAAFPNLVRVNQMARLEREMEPVKVASEQKAIENFLDKVAADLDVIYEFSQVFDPSGDVAQFEGGMLLNPRLVLDKFYKGAYPSGFRFANFPNFTRFAARRILSSEIDALQLFREYEILSGKLLAELAKTDAEKKIVALFSDILILEKLFVLHLDPEDYAKLAVRRDAFAPSAIEQSMKVLDGVTAASQLKFQELDGLAGEAKKFYDVAKRREEFMFRNMLSRIKADRSKVVALVSGGFHEAGFVAFARKHNLNYSIFLPKADPDRSGNYERVMLRSSAPQSSGPNSYLALVDRFQPVETQKTMEAVPSNVIQFQKTFRAAKAASLGTRPSEKEMRYQKVTTEQLIPTLDSILSAGRSDSEWRSFINETHSLWTVALINTLIERLKLSDNLDLLPHASYPAILGFLLVNLRSDLLRLPRHSQQTSVAVNDLLIKLRKYAREYRKDQSPVGESLCRIVSEIERVRFESGVDAFEEGAASESELEPLEQKIGEKVILTLITEVLEIRRKSPASTELNNAIEKLQQSVQVFLRSANEKNKVRRTALNEYALRVINFVNGTSFKQGEISIGTSDSDIWKVEDGRGDNGYRYLIHADFKKLQEQSGGALKGIIGGHREWTDAEKNELLKVKMLKKIKTIIAALWDEIGQASSKGVKPASNINGNGKSLGTESADREEDSRVLGELLFEPKPIRHFSVPEMTTDVAQGFNVSLRPVVKYLNQKTGDSLVQFQMIPMAVVLDEVSLPQTEESARVLIAGLNVSDLIVPTWSVGERKLTVEKPQAIQWLQETAARLLRGVQVKDFRRDVSGIAELNRSTKSFKRGFVVTDVGVEKLADGWTVDHDDFGLRTDLLQQTGISSAQVIVLLRIVESVTNPVKRKQLYQELRLEQDSKISGRWLVSDQFLNLIQEIYAESLGRKKTEQSA
ncbi:MAG: hypothetical protein HZC17_06860 [Candidatus Omnitrophica bacterium]|nr:hypothetical protein [Candidatus Omnitrophota bacterium]